MTQQLIDIELDTKLITELDISHLVIEDDTAMDSWLNGFGRWASTQMKNSPPKTENKARYSGSQFSQVHLTVGAQSFAPSTYTVSKRELI